MCRTRPPASPFARPACPQVCPLSPSARTPRPNTAPPGPSRPAPHHTVLCQLCCIIIYYTMLGYTMLYHAIQDPGRPCCLPPRDAWEERREKPGCPPPRAPQRPRLHASVFLSSMSRRADTRWSHGRANVLIWFAHANTPVCSITLFCCLRRSCD